MTAIDKINKMASQALQKSAQDKSEREKRRSEAARRNRELFPITTKGLEALKEIGIEATVGHALENGNEIGKPDDCEDLGSTVGGVRVVTKR